MKKMGK